MLKQIFQEKIINAHVASFSHTKYEYFTLVTHWYRVLTVHYTMTLEKYIFQTRCLYVPIDLQPLRLDQIHILYEYKYSPSLLWHKLLSVILKTQVILTILDYFRMIILPHGGVSEGGLSSQNHESVQLRVLVGGTWRLGRGDNGVKKAARWWGRCEDVLSCTEVTHQTLHLSGFTSVIRVIESHINNVWLLWRSRPRC